MGNWIVILSILGLLWICIADLRYDHSEEIYVIWYAFSLSFIIFLALNMMAERSGVDIALALGPRFEVSFRSIYFALTDINGELVLVGTFVAFAIVPQFLAYFLSIFSGSARPPQYVRTISRLAVISLIKFLAVWGGIILSNALSRCILHKPISIITLMQGLGSLTAAFAVATAEHQYLDQSFAFELLPGCLVSFDLPIFKQLIDRLHRFSTRNVSGVDNVSRHRTYGWKIMFGKENGYMKCSGPTARLFYPIVSRLLRHYVALEVKPSQDVPADEYKSPK